MKQHTIIFVPHARAKFRKWRITTLQAGLACGAVALLTVSGIVATLLYFNSSFDRDELDQIRAENIALREVNESFDDSIEDLNQQLADYQEKIRRLAIVAGVAELTPDGEAGIGGPLTTDLPMEGGSEDPLNAEMSNLGTQLADMGENLQQLEGLFDERLLLISSTPAVTPVKGLLSSRFGYRSDPFTKQRAFHNGIDIVAPAGKEVYATGDGLVTRAGRANGLGISVFLSHGYDITTRYGHLSRLAVEPGQKVRRGDVIGYVGNTGRSSGYHLHYEVRVQGRPANPLGYILDSTSD